MKLELKQPSIVIIGAWNPAIFQPSWIALHILDYPEGQQVQVRQVLTQDGNPQAVTYFEDLGISVSSHRLEIFINSHDQINLAEQTAIRIINALPHTPLGSFGVNFTFIEDDPEALVIDMFATRENLEQDFRVINQKQVSSLQINDGVVLNFTRDLTDSTVIFNFNYHYISVNHDDFEAKITGKYSELLTKSTQILQKYYELEGYELINHNFPPIT